MSEAMAHGTRMDLLASEFQRFGMAADAATALSCDVVIRHPLAHRLGVPKLTQRLIAHGVARESATHLALALWGLEHLGLGACYQDLLVALRRAGVDDAEAIPACVAARRLWCAASQLAPDVDPDIQLARWCLLFLATLVFASFVARLAA